MESKEPWQFFFRGSSLAWRSEWFSQQLRVGESSYFYPSRVTGGSPFNSVEEKV